MCIKLLCLGAAEAAGTGESSVKLLEGDVAILPVNLPDQLKIIREGNRYLLVASHAGQFKFKRLLSNCQRAIFVPCLCHEYDH